MVIANNFTGANDSEILNNAVQNRGADGIVVIPPRQIDETRDCWLLDSAVLFKKAELKTTARKNTCSERKI